MEDIIGFNDQIGRPKKQSVMTRVNRSLSPKIKLQKPVVKQSVVRTTTPVSSGGGLTAKLKVAKQRQAVRPSVVRPVLRPSVMRPAAKPSVMRPAAKPAQIRMKSSANATSVPSVQRRRVMPKQAVIKPSGQVIPVSRLVRTTAPAAVTRATPIQRSFMPVDLPYNKVQRPSKPMKLVATNFKLPVNIDMIQPPVDAGMSNYYGK